jgi:hypothetical protein
MRTLRNHKFEYEEEKWSAAMRPFSMPESDRPGLIRAIFNKESGKRTDPTNNSQTETVRLINLPD